MLPDEIRRQVIADLQAEGFHPLVIEDVINEITTQYSAEKWDTALLAEVIRHRLMERVEDREFVDFAWQPEEAEHISISEAATEHGIAADELVELLVFSGDLQLTEDGGYLPTTAAYLSGSITPIGVPSEWTS